MTLLFFVGLLLLIVIVALIALLNEARHDAAGASFNPDQVKAKREHLDRALLYARERGTVTNDDIEHLLGVSNATAERYLNELESQGHLVQEGKIGRAVRYRAK